MDGMLGRYFVFRSDVCVLNKLMRVLPVILPICGSCAG